MSDATYGIDIVGHDRTAKGAKSAEKRLAAIPKRAGAAGQRYAQESERSLRRHTRSIVRTFSEVEQAGARVFGGRSITSGISGRLGGISAAARAAGTGLGEAAAAGGVLEGTLGAIGVAAGATVGILAAAGYAAFKLADGWAKGAASIGRTAQIIGVSTTALTEFTAAAERAGVDKGTSAGSLGGLSQTLNDARYGRNAGAQALLAKLGVGMKLKGDGTVDVEAMLPALADAMQRQNSSGARTVASGLGISEAMIPFLRQGGTSLRSEMKDARQHAATLSDADAAIAQRIARKSVMAGQLGERLLSKAGRATAEAAEPGYDAVLSGGQRLMDGASDFGSVVRDTFRPSTERFERAVNSLSGRGGGGLRNGVLSLSQQDVIDLKKTVATEWNKKSIAQGRGVVDTILNRVASGHWGNSVASVVNARSQFSDVNGRPAWQQGRHSVAQIPMTRIDPRTNALVDGWLAARARGARSIIGDNLNYANPNFSDRRNRPWIDAMAGPTLGSGLSVHKHGTTPEMQRYRPGDFQVSSPGQTVQLEHRVTVEDRRTTVKSKISDGSGRAPAVSYGYTPARGG